MATKNWAEGLKDKSRYLLYYEKEKRAGRQGTAQPFGVWLKAQQTVGGESASPQTRRQTETLSKGDAAEIAKHFGKKK
jgi:hypothetical protein